MGSAIKYVLKKAFPVSALQYRAFQTLIKDPSSYLYQTGWMDSLKHHKPVDSQGNPVPWMNFTVVRLLAERLNPALTMFEFGSGYSSLFYAKRVKSVTSVEYDEEWLRTIKATAPANLHLIFQPQDIDGDYCRTVLRTGERYDVVIVDGRDRVNCMKQAIGALTPRGVILLDDSERERYSDGLRYMREQNFRVLDIEGLKGTAPSVVRTSIVYRDGNCLGI